MSDIEVFRDIPGYENLYKVSSHGRIINVKLMSCGRKRKNKFLRLNNSGYTTVRLYKNGYSKTLKLHQIIAIVFKGHRPDGYKHVINHIDFDKTNNNVNNIEIITQRKNTNKKHIKSSSRFVGVSYVKASRKFKAAITVRGKIRFLGLFENQMDAAQAYNNARLRL